MTKYIVEDGFSKIKKTGIGQYTIMLENILSDLKLDTIKVNKNLLEKIKNKTIRRFFYLIWLNSIFLMKLLYINKPITVFFTNFTVPMIKIPNVKYISVIHDLCPFKYPECSSKFINEYEKNNIINAIKKSDLVITVSKTIKKELVETFKLDENKIHVVYNTIPSYFFMANYNDLILNKYNIESKKYILSVATLNKRKNIPLLISAFHEISKKYQDVKLVLIGGMGSEDKKCIMQDNKNIIFTGYIKDEYMPIFYKNALLYVYPSIYEGFGIPILEAQYSNTPLLCTNIEVFKEIAGNGAKFCNLDTIDMVDKIQILLKNPTLINELKKEEKLNIRKFFINSILKQLMGVINA